MFFYHHYIQKGFKPEYLSNLDFYTKQFMMASLDIVLEEKRKHQDVREALIKGESAFPVVTF